MAWKFTPQLGLQREESATHLDFVCGIGVFSLHLLLICPEGSLEISFHLLRVIQKKPPPNCSPNRLNRLQTRPVCTECFQSAALATFQGSPPFGHLLDHQFEGASPVLIAGRCPKSWDFHFSPQTIRLFMVCFLAVFMASSFPRFDDLQLRTLADNSGIWIGKKKSIPRWNSFLGPLTAEAIDLGNSSFWVEDCGQHLD